MGAYWGVRVNSKRTIYLYADAIRINEHGDLMCISKPDQISRAFAAGAWIDVFAAKWAEGGAASQESVFEGKLAGGSYD